MKKMFNFLFAVIVCALCAVPRDAHSYIDKTVATLRIMDKAAGKTRKIDAPVGTMLGIEKLTILVRACKQSDPFDAENFYAFVEITKDGNGKIYSNWMNRNNPGDMPLQNADYDVWLVECK